MRTFAAAAATVLAAFAVIMLIATLSTGGGLWISSWAEPERERIRTETHRESPAFVEGAVKELRRYQNEFIQSDSETHRDLLARLAVAEADKINARYIPDDLAEWIEEMRGRINE